MPAFAATGLALILAVKLPRCPRQRVGRARTRKQPRPDVGGGKALKRVLAGFPERQQRVMARKPISLHALADEIGRARAAEPYPV